ncbi:MAG: Uma2 family endonuclease, partial [Clostridium sp.]|uniref:Uma2 family endonuclease n=1 Tax=Clostridium sp. TaxID=1506 RepID=UPI003F2E2862
MSLEKEIKKYTLEEFEEFQKRTSEKLEYYDGDIVLSSTTSQRHNEIVSNIVSTLNNIIPNGCKVFSEMIEVILKNEFEDYRFKPDAFVVCGDFKKVGESITDVPSIIFEVVSPKYETHDTIRKRLVYELFKVREYNIVFQNGDVIQHIYDFENERYNIEVCHNRDILKSNVFKELNLPVEDIIEGKYIKALRSSMDIGKSLLNLLDDEKI